MDGPGDKDMLTKGTQTLIWLSAAVCVDNLQYHFILRFKINPVVSYTSSNPLGYMYFAIPFLSDVIIQLQLFCSFHTGSQVLHVPLLSSCA